MFDSTSLGKLGLRLTKSYIWEIFCYRMAALISTSEMIEERLPIVKE